MPKHEATWSIATPLDRVYTMGWYILQAAVFRLFFTCVFNYLAIKYRKILVIYKTPPSPPRYRPILTVAQKIFRSQAFYPLATILMPPCSHCMDLSPRSICPIQFQRCLLISSPILLMCAILVIFLLLTRIGHRILIKHLKIFKQKCIQYLFLALSYLQRFTPI